MYSTTPSVAEGKSVFPPSLAHAVPIASVLPEVDWGQMAAFLDMHFRHVELEAGYAIMLRGVGESGTAQEGSFRENVPVPLSGASDDIARVHTAAKRWGAHQVATFAVPA